MSMELVRSIKAELEGRGVSLAGPCGAFEITKRVAWALRGQGAGLHHKPAGNNCQGFSVDFIILNNRAIDILRDAGGENGPAFDDHGPAAEGAWRAPFDPAGVSSGQPPPPAGSDLGVVIGRLDALAVEVGKLRDVVQQLIERPAPPVNIPAVRFPDYEGSIDLGPLGKTPVLLEPKS